MELKQLKYFITIVESGSLGKAAQKLEVGTSALSQQIAKLEDELCTRLLQRNSTGVTPTPSGLAFFKQAQLSLRHIQYAVEAAHSSRLTGHVSVGFSPSIASVLGIPFMQLMSQRYPDIKIHLVESLSGNLTNLVNSRQLDIAIIFTQDVDVNWAVQPLLKEQMFLMANSCLLKSFGFDQCIQEGRIDLEKINRLPLVLPSQRHGLRKFLDQKVEGLDVNYEIDGLHLLMNCVSNLNLATIQPVSAHFDYLKTDICLLKVVEPELDRVNYLISLSEEELSPASLATKVAIKSCVKELINNGLWPSAELLDF
ncbi:LysR family transcriptional regulator [Acinetobacter sp. ANC 4945]|uniref:LysR family transcriptional regulator n=1 Tax=Acinetobacter amyesii TaxID=2942470 RepID=A0A1T1H1F6_9GAMM|nr:LysR family transcriptional regulator [Acinetobacter amyesii]MCL6248795.1 LysR family transcriptional regulator [Acinetobacter amyesii]OOV83530.1 LysR family transcriptional regulator [Acinetobacter amyesii]